MTTGFMREARIMSFDKARVELSVANMALQRVILAYQMTPDPDLLKALKELHKGQLERERFLEKQILKAMEEK